jgi:hypothetical protein
LNPDAGHQLNPDTQLEPNALQQHVAVMQQQARMQLALQQQQQQYTQQQYMQLGQVSADPAISAPADWQDSWEVTADVADPAVTAMLQFQQQQQLRQQQQQQWR